MAVKATTHPNNQSVPFPLPNFPDFTNVQKIPFSGIPSSAMLPLEHAVDDIESVHRKRSRDIFNAPSFLESQMKTNVDSSQFSSFFDESNILPQIQQNQLEIDSIMSQHTKKMRLDLQEKQKLHAKLMATVIGEKAISKLKEKEEQIQKMGKLNWALQERVKCLLVENQLWKDLAKENEAQAHSFRADLEQAMAHFEAQQDRVAGDDVESCCGSSGDDVEGGDWMCKICGERESSVVVFPCHHLCLCNVCGSGVHHVQVCPVCNSGMSGTLHVNMSR